MGLGIGSVGARVAGGWLYRITMTEGRRCMDNTSSWRAQHIISYHIIINSPCIRACQPAQALTHQSYIIYHINPFHTPYNGVKHRTNKQMTYMNNYENNQYTHHTHNMPSIQRQRKKHFVRRSAGGTIIPRVPCLCQRLRMPTGCSCAF